MENPYISILEELVGRIGSAGGRSPLFHPPVTIVGASKGQQEAALRRSIEAGLTHFGENRVQEATQKWVAIKKEYPQVTLHLIGPLQTNKVEEAVALFDVIETLDREKLCDALAKEMQKQKKHQRCFVQVNVGEEPQKSGVLPRDADALIVYAKNRGLDVVGLMCVPPADENPAPHFALLHEIAKRNGLRELSMGMSNDFETAVRMGATQVRLGTVLFGERQ